MIVLCVCVRHNVRGRQNEKQKKIALVSECI